MVLILRKQYLSIGRQNRIEFEEKRSRFIATVKPVSAEEETIAFINDIRAEHRTASHNVYAYCTSDPTGNKRYSDDGEPQGTAGIPVLNVIEKNGLEDIVIVVTRYFGGTLLGAAGLVRAYSRAAAMAVDGAGIVRYTLCENIHVVIGYQYYSVLKSEIETRGFAVKDLEFGLDVELTVQVDMEASDNFISRVADLSAGSGIAEKSGVSYSCQSINT